MIQLQEIGTVENQFTEPTDHVKMRQEESLIHIKPEFRDGLYRIERNDYIQVIFGFDRAEGYSLIGTRRGGRELGVFASRSPKRPSSLGSTVVRLLEVNGGTLRVKGLDALDGTPVLDIKPHALSMDAPGYALKKEELRANPRSDVERLIADENWERLLLKAGELHGHFCPGLALGVRAGAYALKELGLSGSDGMEEIMAVVETNSCFSDGIQYSTGCTFGNNALVYRDYGKTAFSLTTRSGTGIRMYFDRRDNYLEGHSEEAAELFEKVIAQREGTEEDEEVLKKRWGKLSFYVVETPPEELFNIERDVEVELPDYAPIYDSAICEECGEKVMAPKIVEEDGSTLCIPCANGDYVQLDGRGLSSKERPQN